MCLDHKALLVWILNYAGLHQPNHKLYCYKSIFFSLNKPQCHLVFSKMTSSERLILIQYSAFKLSAHSLSLQYSASSWLQPAWSTVSTWTSKTEAHRFPLKRPQYMNYATKSLTAVQYRIRTTDHTEHSPRNLPSMFCSSPILGKRIHLAPHIRETRQFR